MRQWQIRLIALIVVISVGIINSGCALLVIGGAGAAGGYYYRKGLDKKGKSTSATEPNSNSTNSDTTGHHSYSTGTTSK